MPGRYFLIQYDREEMQYKLTLDAPDTPSYALGDDAIAVVDYLTRLGLRVIGESAVNIAREFGAAQAVLSDGRVIPIFKRPSQERPQVVFKDGDQETNRASYPL